MFWGEAYCERCDYKGPDLMWMWHHGIGLHVLVQNKESHELRVIEVEDGAEFYRMDGESEEDRASRVTEYVNRIVRSQLAGAEERIDSSRIARWEFESHGLTDIPCPRCATMLRWRGTGIS